MRIMIAYPGHVCSTIDVASGYSRALSRLGHTVWRFDYHTRLSFYQTALKAFEDVNSGFVRRDGDYLVLASESIVPEVIDFIPDVVVMVNGLSLHYRAFELLYKLKVPVVMLYTESPYADELQARAAKNCGAVGVLVNDLYSVDYMRKESGKPTEYLPHSYDLEVHRKFDFVSEAERKRYESDLFFFGTLWPERAELLNRLKGIQNGWRFNIGGVELWREPGTPLPDFIQNAEMARYYNGTRIAFNHHRTICGQDPEGLDKHLYIESGSAYSTGPRTFEIAACGAFQLCDDTREEVYEVFGDSIPVYENGDDLLEKVKYYLDNPAERLALAGEAYTMVHSCSFDDRAREILIPFLQEVV